MTEDRPPSPIDKLTFAGRLLLISTMLLFGGGFYVSFLFIGENFPSGSYPLIIVILPICITCFLYFLVGVWILRRLGVQVFTGKDSNELNK